MNKLLDRMLQELDDLPDAEQVRITHVLEAELRRAKGAAPGRRRAAVGEHLAALDLLKGESAAFGRAVRGWRDNAGIGEGPPSPAA